MTDRLDVLLKALPAPAGGADLDGLEPLVWRRIRARQATGADVRTQLVAAGMALGIGLALGWTMTNAQAQHRHQTELFAGYAQVGPLGRLEGPL
jgi:hypothetical protein